MAIRDHLTKNGFINVTLSRASAPFVGSYIRPPKKVGPTDDERYKRQKDMNKAKSQKLHNKKLVEKWAKVVIAAKVKRFEDLQSKKHWRTSADHLIPLINDRVDELLGMVPTQP